MTGVSEELTITSSGEGSSDAFSLLLIRDGTPKQLLVPAAHDMKQAMIEQGKRPATVNRKLAVVRRILNVAFREWGWIDQPLGQKIQLVCCFGSSI